MNPDVDDSLQIALNELMAACLIEPRAREARLLVQAMDATPTVTISVETYEKLKRAARSARLGNLSHLLKTGSPSSRG